MRDKVEDIDELKKIATQVRRDILQMVFNASSGHPIGSIIAVRCIKSWQVIQSYYVKSKLLSELI